MGVSSPPTPGARVKLFAKPALGSFAMTPLVVAALAFRAPAMHVHADRDRTALPRRGLVSLAEVPPADLKTALPPSLAEALAADDSLADAQLTCVLLATAGECCTPVLIEAATIPTQAVASCTQAHVPRCRRRCASSLSRRPPRKQAAR